MYLSVTLPTWPQKYISENGLTFKITWNEKLTTCSSLNNPNFKDFGTYHVTSLGDTDWFHYACFIVDEAIDLGFKTSMTSKDIKPIPTSLYSTLAKRPMNSRLNITKIKKTLMLELPHWETEVKKILKEIIR